MFYIFQLCLKDRDLRPGVMFEYQSIIKLISDRCNWLIIIVSNDFSNSPWNRFIMNYIQSLAIGKAKNFFLYLYSLIVMFGIIDCRATVT